MATTAHYCKVENLAYISHTQPNTVIEFGDSVRLPNYIIGEDEAALLGTVTPIDDPTDWKYNRIVDAYLSVGAIYDLGFDVQWATLSIRGLKAPYNPATVTWNNSPGFVYPWTTGLAFVTIAATTYYRYTIPRHETGAALDPVSLSTFAKLVINNGFALDNFENTTDITRTVNCATVRTGRQSEAYEPYFYITTDDDFVVLSNVVGADKTSGYYSGNVARTFSWKFEKVGPYSCYGDWTQASAVFHWRNGTSGAWNDIPATGSTQSVTIPANTFPLSNTLQWYVSAVDNVGTASDSPVYTISTADSLATASPIAPIGTVEDGSDDIVFTWQENNDTGTTPTGADLQYSQDGTTWTALAHVDGAATSYTVPGDSLPPGTVLWQVRAYNADGVAGNWSEAASFVSVTAPPAPTVAATAVPFSAVSWQATGQQAFRITVDSTVYGPYFGTFKTWTVPDFLAGGEHTITVEVQGVYGLWSQPGSASFTVQNQPGDAVTLSGEFERDGVLSWVTASQTADFLIYRDGVQIGHTSAPSFIDRIALGEHSYQVINRLPDGNYTASNIVTGTMLSCVAAIAPLTGGSWIELTLSENSNREESFVWTQAVSMRHFAGAEYPVAEQSPFADLSGSYDVSFADLPSAKAFEALRGQAVILKSRGGNVMIGILSTLSKRMTEFYIAFTFSLQRMHWRDFIDADDQL